MCVRVSVQGVCVCVWGGGGGGGGCGQVCRGVGVGVGVYEQLYYRSWNNAGLTTL